MAAPGGRGGSSEAPGWPRPPRPGTAALGRAGGGVSGGGASWPAWLGGRPGHVTARPECAGGAAAAGSAALGARAAARGTQSRAGDVAAASPARKFPGSWRRAVRGRRGHHERVPDPRRPEPPPSHDLAPGEDLEVQVLLG